MPMPPRRARSLSLFAATAAPAFVLVAGCSSNPFVHENPPPTTVTATATLVDTPHETAPGLGTPSDAYPGMDPSGATPGETPTTTVPENGGLVPVPTSTTPGASGTAGATGGSRASGTTAVVDGRTITGLPAGLVFPGGTKVDVVTTGQGDGGTVILTAPKAQTLLNHFRAVLPRAGYQITSDAGGAIAFTGKGFDGTITGNNSGGVVTWGSHQG